MTLVLLYLAVLILIALVLFGVASLLFGRGESLPPLPQATTATVLPASGVTSGDIDAVKFTQVLRGYKTSEVDWVLDRLGRELDQLRGQLAASYAASYAAENVDHGDHGPEGAGDSREGTPGESSHDGGATPVWASGRAADAETEPAPEAP